MIYDVAISYAIEDIARLEQIEEMLKRAGLSVWTDQSRLSVGEGQAERLVPAGVAHREAIRDAIDHAATFVFLDSPHWRESGYCGEEWSHARKRGVRTIAARGAGGGVEAAAKVAERDDEALLAAVRQGLDVSRAHARVRAVALPNSDPVAPGIGVAVADVTALSEANLGVLGISISPQITAAMDDALDRDRRRRRRVGGGLVAGVVATALLAAIAVAAWIAAQQDEEHATDAAQHVESLAIATASENASNTFAQLALARRAIDLEQNPTTVAALRDGVEAFGEGISISLDRGEPSAIAVANNGNVATVQRTGAVTLVPARRGGEQREVPAEMAAAAPSVSFSPDGSKVAVVRGENGVAEIIDFKTAHLVRVAGTPFLAAIVFISDRRAIAVGYEGGLFEFDPQDPHPQAQKAGSVSAPVRAATLASVGPDGTFTLATLTDGAVEVNEVGRVDALLRVLLPQEQSPFAIGWESLRVCGGNLSVLATATAPQISTGFGVPYTIHADGRLVQTGSLINSLGLICLPGGSVLAADPLHGQYTFPAREGPMLPGLATGTDEGVTYSFASSENNQWATAAGTDGTLKIVELESYGQQRPVQSLEVVAPGAPGAPLVVSHGEVHSAPLAGGTGPKIADGVGGAARGSYYDPRWGTVLAIGKELLIVRNDHVRQRIAIDHSIYEIGPGRPGVSTLVVLANAREAIDVALAGGQWTTIELPPDVIGGATQLSDTVELPGPRPRLVTATTDGYLDLLSYPSGKELRRRRVAPPGPVSLALSSDGHLLASASDGIVRILDPQTLAIEGSRRVLSAGPSLISTNMAGTLAAVFSGGGEAVVLDLPSLDPITHVNSIEALVSVSFEGERSLLLGSDLHYIGGGDQASVTTWPLCRACGGNPAQLRVRAEGLAEPRPSRSRPTFEPVSSETHAGN